MLRCVSLGLLSISEKKYFFPTLTMLIWLMYTALVLLRFDSIFNFTLGGVKSMVCLYKKKKHM